MYSHGAEEFGAKYKIIAKSLTTRDNKLGVGVAGCKLARFMKGRDGAL